MNRIHSNGEKPLYDKAVEMLEALGTLQKAQGRVSVSKVHLVSTFASKMGEGGIEIIERIANEGNVLRVSSTTDPCDIEPQYRRQLHFSDGMISRQKRLNDGLLRLGAIPTWSCIPYLEGAVPRFGEHVAWGESSAVIFANSILGAMTNKTSVFEDLFAGLTGWIPRYGMHIKKERRGSTEINLIMDGKELTEQDCGLIGYWIGTHSNNKIPVVTGFPKGKPLSCLISMLACAAIASSLPLVHVVGVTPEARTAEEAFQDQPPEVKLNLRPEDLQAAKRELSTVSEGKVDGVILGCPHYSIDKVKKVAQMLDGRKVKKGIRFWIMTTQGVRSIAKQMGIDRKIRNAGPKLLVSTCCFHFPPASFGRSEIFMTDSAKGCYLIPSMIQKKAIFASTRECVEAAITGEYVAE